MGRNQPYDRLHQEEDLFVDLAAGVEECHPSSVGLPFNTRVRAFGA
jgi:hypothetical protein